MFFYVEKSPEFEIEEFFVGVVALVIGMFIGGQIW